MLTALLSKKKAKDPSKVVNRPLIQVVGGEPADSAVGASAAAVGGGSPQKQQDEEFDWQTDQQLPPDNEVQLGHK